MPVIRQVAAIVSCVVLASPLPGAEPLPLLSPGGGECWAAGSSHLIRWPCRASDLDMSVTVSLSTDAGDSWRPIASRVSNNGEFRWTVPDAASNSSRIRVVGDDGRTWQSSAPFTIASSAAVEYEWTEVTQSAPFAPRDGAGALVFKNRMWLLGGWNPGDKRHFPRVCNNEVWSSTDGRDWTLERPNTFLDRSFDPKSDWEGRHTAGYAVYKGKMWIVGGDVNQGHYQSDVWNSDDGTSWTLVNDGQPVPWGPRALHYTVVHRGQIWVIGGQTMPAFAPSEERFYRDVWKTSDGRNWTQVDVKEPFWPQRGMIGGSAVFKDRIWILGGGTYDTPRKPDRLFYNDVWSSADGVNWEQHLANAPWSPRQYHDVAVYDDRLWVLEGYHREGGNRNDVWYSADGANWYEVPNTPWKPRHAASVFVHDGGLWMVAGNNMTPDVWRLQRKSKPAAQ